MAQTLKRTGGILIIALIVAFAFCLEPSMAATKSMKTYGVIKTGNTAYCCDGNQIFKVNLKKNTRTKLTKYNLPIDEGMDKMKKKDKYIYFIKSDTETSAIYRVNVKTRKTQKLTKSNWLAISDYAISGKKIYYGAYNWETDTFSKKVMKLNGKGVKSTSYTAKTIMKETNKKGYKVIVNYSDTGMKSWLKKPSGEKIFLQEVKSQY